MLYNSIILFIQITLCCGILLKLYLNNYNTFNLEEWMLLILSIITIIISSIYADNIDKVNNSKDPNTNQRKYNDLFDPIGLILNTVLSGIFFIISFFIFKKYNYNRTNSWILTSSSLMIPIINIIYILNINKVKEYARINAQQILIKKTQLEKKL
jgi:hypothetical protein